MSASSAPMLPPPADQEQWADFQQRFLAGDETAYQRAVREHADG